MPSKTFCIREMCVTNTLPLSERQKLFYLPTTQEKRIHWLNQLDRRDLMLLTNTELQSRGCRVCVRHFDEKDFTCPLKLKLKYEAVPKGFAEGPSWHKSIKRFSARLLQKEKRKQKHKGRTKKTIEERKNDHVCYVYKINIGNNYSLKHLCIDREHSYAMKAPL